MGEASTTPSTSMAAMTMDGKLNWSGATCSSKPHRELKPNREELAISIARQRGPIKGLKQGVAVLNPSPKTRVEYIQNPLAPAPPRAVADAAGPRRNVPSVPSGLERDRNC